MLIERHYKRNQPRKKTASTSGNSSFWSANAADDDTNVSGADAPSYRHRKSDRRGGLTEMKRSRDSVAIVQNNQCRHRATTTTPTTPTTMDGDVAAASVETTGTTTSPRMSAGSLEAMDTLADLTSAPAFRESMGSTPLKTLMQDREARRIAAEQRSANQERGVEALEEVTSTSETINVISSASNAQGGGRRRSAVPTSPGTDGSPVADRQHSGGGGASTDSPGRGSTRRTSTSFFIPDLSSVLIDSHEQEVVHLLSFRMLRHAIGLLMHLVAAMPTEAIGGSLGQSLKWILTLKVRPSRPVVVCSAP